MKAALYESDITPPLGCYQTGYGIKRIAEDVYSRLYSKALVIEQDGKYAVIISVDICEYPVEMHDIVSKRIYEYTGIAPENVCIHSTHCHWGAPVTDSPQIGCYGDKTYTDIFYRLVADSAILAYRRLDDAVLSFASTNVHGIANNRCSYLKDGTLKTFEKNPELIKRPLCEPDHELPVLFIEQNGKKVGALYCFGCHQDTVSLKPYGYCSDFSGEVSKHLKEKFGSDFISIYLAGPSGDINHINIFASEVMSYEKIGKKISDAIIDISDSAAGICDTLNVIKKKITIPKRKYSNDEFLSMASEYVQNKQLMQLTNLVQYHRADYENSRDLYVQIITVGDLAIYVYPGEMFVEYSHRTKKQSPFKYNMVIENSNAYGGYIPCLEAFDEKSELYEIAPAHDSFLIPDAGEILLSEALKLAEDIKKQM